MKRQPIDADPLNIERIWQEPFRGDFCPGGRINTAAISAIDLALWDIKGKGLEQQPVHMQLGGRLRKRVTCCTAIGGSAPSDTTRTGLERIAGGWKYLRLAVVERQGVL